MNKLDDLLEQSTEAQVWEFARRLPFATQLPNGLYIHELESKYMNQDASVYLEKAKGQMVRQNALQAANAIVSDMTLCAKLLVMSYGMPNYLTSLGQAVFQSKREWGDPIYDMKTVVSVYDSAINLIESIRG